MLADLPDDELLNVPLSNLQPGELARAFFVQAEHSKKKLLDFVSEQSSLTALQRRREEETNHERDELHRREEILLTALRDREKAIFEEAEALDKRTIKLNDGRRAYIDGDGFRDAQGRELKDADRAEAEQHHLEHPDAATWSEKQAIEEKRQATEALRRKVETLQAGDAGADQAKTLNSLEKEFQTNVAAPTAALPDYGDGDYMAAYGLKGDFKHAATSPGAPKPGDSTKPVPVVVAPKALTL